MTNHSRAPARRRNGVGRRVAPDSCSEDLWRLAPQGHVDNL